MVTLLSQAEISLCVSDTHAHTHPKRKEREYMQKKNTFKNMTGQTQ